ncbi:probable myosin-binding protein 4 [Impatiens glandulifera]|uniref:probable myosin-binding protein 4 n=1 Tax=Impatiens glandulifera TaxID=253017 RepID=UPI001FB05590|nr:probable myosin-binding protein 4 [Impatiens glandulifera]
MNELITSPSLNMDTSISQITLERNPRGFVNALYAMASEWILVLLLFIDAALSYLLTRFAHHCKLQIPCILCSRLDHIFGDDNVDFYTSLLCKTHKKEISSLVYCDSHGKLTGACGMCEECLVSLVLQNGSNMESIRSLMGKLGMDIHNLMPSRDTVSFRTCNCCSKLWTAIPLPKAVFQRQLQLPSSISRSVRNHPKPPLPRPPGQIRLNNHESLKKIRDRFSKPISPQLGKPRVDNFSYVGYTELKITSDTESEFPFSDDEDVNSVVPEIIIDDKEVHVQHRGKRPTVANTLLDQYLLKNENVSSDIMGWVSKIGDDIEGINWQQAKGNHNDIVSKSTAAVEIPNSHVSTSKNQPFLPGNPSSLEDNGKPMYNVNQSPVVPESDEKCKCLIYSLFCGCLLHFWLTHLCEIILTADAIGTCQITSKSDDYHVEFPETPDSTRYAVIDSVETDNAEQKDDNAGQESVNNNVKVEVEGVSGKQSVISGFEVTEIEGESIIDRLKRQTEHYRQCMAELCRELDAERNASSVAANEAMAMITRLQEEKASLHMEALQQLRMMEEQAEYDMDALDKANELLAEKEKEVQDLEAELEIYQMNPPAAEEEEEEGKGNNNSLDMKSSSLDYNAESNYISQCLKELERKLNQIICRNGNEDKKKLIGNGNSNGEDEKEDEKGEFRLVKWEELNSVENEIFDLNMRLEVLEADHEVLAQVLYSLKNGHGLQFIQEVARQLHELRKAVIDSTLQSSASTSTST